MKVSQVVLVVCLTVVVLIAGICGVLGLLFQPLSPSAREAALETQREHERRMEEIRRGDKSERVASTNRIHDVKITDYNIIEGRTAQGKPIEILCFGVQNLSQKPVSSVKVDVTVSGTFGSDSFDVYAFLADDQGGPLHPNSVVRETAQSGYYILQTVGLKERTRSVTFNILEVE